jgi:hypothetical protein
MQGNFTNLKLPKRSRFPAVLAAATQKHLALPHVMALFGLKDLV